MTGRDRTARPRVSRRDALRLGTGAAAGAAAGAGVVALAAPTQARVRPATATPALLAASVPPGTLEVYINEGYVPMVDGALVYHRGYGSRPTSVSDPRPSLTLPPHVFTAAGELRPSRTYPLTATVPPHGRPAPARPDSAHRGEYLVHRRRWASYFPDRTLIAETGSTVRLRVHNRLAQPHELAVHLAPGQVVTTGRISPGTYRDLQLGAPAPGTYLFTDRDADLGNRVERVLGLFGVLLVMPAANPWVPFPMGPEFERQWLWICHDIEPEWARTASRGGTVNPDLTTALPRYFTLNDRSGYQSLGVSTDIAGNELRHEDTLPSGSARHVDVRNFGRSTGTGTVGAGQLIRLVNPGIVRHQMHFHGNHVWTVRRNNVTFPRSAAAAHVDGTGHVVLQQWEDVVELEPMERKDSVLPVRRPPEAVDAVWNARKGDWIYPMHCHAEPSQTAAGGLYPGGLVADWTLAAPVAGGTS